MLYIWGTEEGVVTKKSCQPLFHICIICFHFDIIVQINDQKKSQLNPFQTHFEMDPIGPIAEDLC